MGPISMKSADWNAALLILFGCLLGFIGCVLFYPYIPPLPNGWGSILGSALGAAGAFIAASWSFSRHQDADRARTLRPYRERYELAIYMLPKVQPLLQEAATELQKLYTHAVDANSHRPLPKIFEPRTVRELSTGTLEISPERLERIQHDCNTLLDMFQNFSRRPLEEAIYALRNVTEALTWIAENMEATLPPKDMFRIRHSLDCLTQARQKVEEARTGPMNAFVYTSPNRFDEREARAIFITCPAISLAKTQEALNALQSIELQKLEQ